ncbi:MAG: amino acid dehydrogenase, partial [Pseudomonadales bacterium]
GPALGGCRMWAYPAEVHAVTDVLRLSRGMTYKSAISALPLGGGKAVIVGDPRTLKSRALLEAMGRFIDSFDGRYITAEDSGTDVETLSVMGTQTPYVAGISDKRLSDGSTVNGDPSPSTAHGVFKGIEAAVNHYHGIESLKGVRVAVQGVGNVGRQLVKRLALAGAELTIADVNPDSIDKALDIAGARVVNFDVIHKQEVEVFAPCALGGIISTETLPQMKARIIAGAANNQLADEAAGYEVFTRAMGYAPDYVINAGGIIDVYYQRAGYEHNKVIAHIDRIGDTLNELFRRSDEAEVPTHVMADRLAEARFLNRKVSRVA